MQPIPYGIQLPSNNALINGKNNFDCSTTNLSCVDNAGLASFNFTAGKSHRLRLINPSAQATMKFSIDDHIMTVIANDFVEVEPYNTSVVTLALGQRTDVIVHATGQPGDSYWMRTFAPPDCTYTYHNLGNYAQAIVYYTGGNATHGTNATSGTAQPTSQAVDGWDNDYCGNDALSLTKPLYAMDPGQPSTTETIVIDYASNGTHMLWYMNNQTFRIDLNDPILLDAINGNDTFDPIASVHNYGSNTSVRFIVENHSGEPHPMHLHGHNIFVLAEGYCTSATNGTTVNSTAGVTTTAGTAAQTATMTVSSTAAATPTTGSCWDGTIVNPSNPQRRDVQQLLPGGYIVLQWNQDNPGIWAFHCHIAWHISTGFLWNVLEQPDQIPNIDVPSGIHEVCKAWWDYTDNIVVDQIDSGE